MRNDDHVLLVQSDLFPISSFSAQIKAKYILVMSYN